MMDRGPEGTITPDMGCMEGYDAPVVAGDPLKLAQSFREYCREASVPA